MKRRWQVIVTVLVVASTLHVGRASAAGAIGEVYVVKKADVPSGSRKTLTVMCPDGRPILSGEVYVSGLDLSLEVASSGPVDGKDRDHQPDDGWRGSINNDGPDKQEMDVRAQCGSRHDRKVLRYVQQTATAPANNISGGTVSCAAGETAVSGGAIVPGKTRSAPFAETIPDDGDDAGTSIGDGWTVKIWNSSMEPVDMAVTVICAQLPGPITFATSALTAAPPATESSAFAPCPASSYAIGGGVVFVGVPLTIASTEMVLDGSSTGWRGYVNNTTGTSSQFFAESVCYSP